MINSVREVNSIAGCFVDDDASLPSNDVDGIWQVLADPINDTGDPHGRTSDNGCVPPLLLDEAIIILRRLI